MFYQVSRRSISRPANKTGPVFAVGRRMFVNSPASPKGQIVLTDYAGETPLRSLADGTEVEILAWRPLGLGGARYQVHSLRDCREGWLATENLRVVRRLAKGAAPVGVLPRQAAVARPQGAGRKARKPSRTSR